jgi:hypothetical protein
LKAINGILGGRKPFFGGCKGRVWKKAPIMSKVFGMVILGLWKTIQFQSLEAKRAALRLFVQVQNLRTSKCRSQNVKHQNAERQNVEVQNVEHQKC